MSHDHTRTLAADLPRETAGSRGSRRRWLIDRIRAMTAAEVLVRGRQVARIQADVAAARLLGDAPRVRRVRHGDRADPGTRPRVFTRERARRCRRVAPEQVQRFLAAAGAMAEGEFAFLGYAPVSLARPLAYEADPFGGGLWPRRHGLTLDYRTTTVGDPKWIWELNRLQHVPALLAAALLAGDDRLAEIARGDLWSWLAQARTGRGIGWSNAYEPGLRAISLALSLDALRDERLGDPALCDALCRSLRRHVRFIERYPSLHSSANNHRVGELVGVIVAAALASELALDGELGRALDELRVRCAEQFAADGSHREQAFGYAVFTTELVLLCAGVLERAGRGVPPWMADVLDRVAGALHAQLGDGDPEPRYGDRDDGGPTLLGAPVARTGRALLGALALAREDTLGDAPHLDLTALWLFGDAGSDAARVTQDGTAAASAWLPDVGLALLRAGETTVSVDLGPLGFGRLAAHGHADALQLTVAHGGRELIGDPGTGSYFGNPAVREAFRGTAMHATVLVDGRDQVDAAGPFLWSAPPRVDVLALDLDARVAAGEHDGYGRLADPVAHRRGVALLDEGLVLVHDQLRAAGRHAYSQRWPLTPDATATVDGPDRIVVGSGELTALVVWVASAPVSAELADGHTGPLVGWWSDALERVRPAPLVCLDATAQGTLELVTAVALDPLAPHELPDVTLDVDWNTRMVTIGGARRWQVALEDDGRLRAQATDMVEAIR